MNLERIGTVIQGSALLVALSVIFGRIFVLSRDKAIGIAIPLGQLDPIDYAIISPDIAVLSVGLSIFVVFNWFWRPPKFDYWRWDLTIYGGALFVLGILMELFGKPTAGSLLDEPGSWGLFNLLRIISILLGIGFLFQSVPRKYERSLFLGSTEEEADETRKQLRSIYPVLLGMYLVMMFVMALSFVWAEGERDANRQLRFAPLAFVSYGTSQLYNMAPHNTQQECVISSTEYLYKVFSIDDTFAYLLQPDVETWENNPPLLALPVAQIEAIEYINCNEPEYVSTQIDIKSQFDVH